MKNKGQFIKGQTAWNKGGVGFHHTLETRKKIVMGLLGRPVSLATRQRLSETHKRINHKPPSRKGEKCSVETRKKIGDSKRGHVATLETRMKMSNSMKGKNSKGGITPINLKLRGSLEYKLWREAVFKRDNWTCLWCGMRSGNGKTTVLNADHIKPFAYFPELRFAIDNGRTLCVDCHRKTDTFLGRAINFYQPITL